MKPCTYCGNKPNSPASAAVGEKGCPVCFRSDDFVDVVAGQHLPQPLDGDFWNRDTSASFATILAGGCRVVQDNVAASAGVYIDREHAERIWTRLGALLGKFDVPEAKPDPTTALSASEWRAAHEYAALNRHLGNQWMELPTSGGWAKLLFESDLTRECTLIVGDVAIRERAWPRPAMPAARDNPSPGVLQALDQAARSLHEHSGSIALPDGREITTWTEPQTGAKVPLAPTSAPGARNWREPWLTQATSAEQPSPLHYATQVKAAEAMVERGYRYTGYEESLAGAFVTDYTSTVDPEPENWEETLRVDGVVLDEEDAERYVAPAAVDETPTWQLPANLQEVEWGYAHGSFYLGDALMFLSFVEVEDNLPREGNGERVEDAADGVYRVVNDNMDEELEKILTVAGTGSPYTVTWQGRQWVAVAFPAEN